MNFLVILLSFNVFLEGKTQAQEGISLKAAISESLSQSPAVQKSQAAVEEVEWKKIGSYSGFLPSVSGNINYLTNKKYALLDTAIGNSNITIPQVIPTTTYGLTLTVPLFDGKANINRYHATLRLEESTKSDLDWTRFQTQRQVMLQFYRSLAARELKIFSEQNLKTLSEHLKDSGVLKKAGIATQYDVLRVEVQVSEAKSEVFNANDNFEMSKFRLGEVLGKDREDRDPQGELPILKASALDNVKSFSANSRSDIVAMEKKSEASSLQTTAAEKYWVPKISAFGQYQYYNNISDSFTDYSVFRSAYQMGLQLNWIIFDGMSSISRAHESAAQNLQLTKGLELTKLHAKQDFEFWRRKFLYFCHITESRSADIERSSEAVRLAKEGRRAGARTNSELLDAELDLFRTQAGLINAKLGAVEALINLELATGSVIFFE